MRLCLLACVFVLLSAPVAAAAVAPLDGQVNADAGNGIDPARDAGASDVVGGALTAGKLEIPWGTFEQQTTGAQNVFVRAFKNGAWVTEGFPASLNISAAEEAEEPSIDFAGTGRTVPWVSWYEPNDAFGSPTNIFASRFKADAVAQGGGVWIPEGQDRSAGGKLPSLNIHTNRTAENPSVAGGAALAGADPVPWVVWDEHDGATTDAAAPVQIFVSRAIKLAAPGGPCATTPAGGNSTGTFCWQQVGLERLGATSGASSATGDPTLNIDPTRDGVEPDIAFTGPSDTVAWAVWYEEGDSGLPGFRGTGNDQVFAAKISANAAADGGFQWIAVGNGTTGQTNVLDRTGANGFGACAVSQAADDACALNKVATADAENPRVASGSLAAGSPTVPWVVWEESVGGGDHGIFVSRLVGGDHFALFNDGQPISVTTNEATRPDIAFSGHVPYVTWHETVGGHERLFAGHFEGTAFHLDTPDGIAPSSAGNVADLRAPVSSTCTATPFSADGTTCRGGAAGTPFALLTEGTGPQQLLSFQYEPTEVATGAAGAVTQTGATLSGSANPGGAAAVAGFEVGRDTAYGTKLEQPLPIGDAARGFTAAVAGLSPGTTFHYRAFARSDFTTVVGPDATFTTAPQTNPPPANRRPTSAIKGLGRKIKARKLKRIHGTASDPDDGVASVSIAVTRLAGGAHAARARCFVMKANGRFKKAARKRGKCRPSFLRAKGTTKWSFKLKRRLRKGRYEVYSRARDAAGQRQAGFTKASRRALKVK